MSNDDQEGCRNPVSVMRTDLAISQAELAKLAGVSKGYILRLEQGLFETPSPKVMAVLGPREPYKFRQHYRAFRESCRHRIAREIQESPPYYQPTYESDTHPFKAWREANWPGLSQVGFCKMIRYNPSGLRSYEGSFQFYMPRTLWKALAESGIDLELLGRINLEVSLWAAQKTPVTSANQKLQKLGDRDGADEAEYERGA